MKKEYQVIAQQEWQRKREPDKWWNVGFLLDSKRVYHTLEEAQSAVDRYLEQWNGVKVYNEKGERYETQYAGCIGISTVHTKKTDEDMRVVAIKIKEREVTEWEETEVELPS